MCQGCHKDYMTKQDSDLETDPHWLQTAAMLEPEVGVWLPPARQPPPPEVLVMDPSDIQMKMTLCVGK